MNVAMARDQGRINADSSECCQYLSWDSKHFGLRIGRVTNARLTESSIEEISQWTRDNAIDCLYFLADPDPATLRLAMEAGFRFVDIRTTLEVSLDEPPPERTFDVRLARREDVNNLRRIAGRSHHGSRFYSDGNFAQQLCDELYRIWIERSCLDSGFASEVLVVERQAHVLGYVTYRLSSTLAEIGLVGIDQDFRGQGLGKLLLGAAVRRMQERGAETARVITQGTNVPALRLYQRFGFRPVSVGLWYHLWGTRHPEARGGEILL